MDNRRRRVLVVARNSRVADNLAEWLAGGGRETTVVRSFGEGKARLVTRPDVLIAEVKLGEYNGLHLALKAEAAGVPAILIGPADPVLQRDAEGVRAIYLTTLTRLSLAEAVDGALSGAPPAHRLVPFRARATTVAEEAETIWRAFSESPTSQLTAFGRPMLPN